jgi:hypothetical protein
MAVNLNIFGKKPRRQFSWILSKLKSVWAMGGYFLKSETVLTHFHICLSLLSFKYVMLWAETIKTLKNGFEDKAALRDQYQKNDQKKPVVQLIFPRGTDSSSANWVSRRPTGLRKKL